MLYRDGKGMEPDLATAILYLTKAVQCGNPMAMVYLACIYIRGLEGIERDLQKGTHLLEMGSKGFPSPITEFYWGMVKIRPESPYYNKDEARAHLIAAESADEDIILQQLALFWEFGAADSVSLGVDIPRAIRLWQKVAQRGDGDSMIMLARLYYKERNMAQCRKWLIKAINTPSWQSWGVEVVYCIVVPLCCCVGWCSGMMKNFWYIFFFCKALHSKR